MNSSLYITQVFHKRNVTSSYRFRHKIFTWLLDLDELPVLQKKYPLLFGQNRIALFSFYDKDHFRFLSEKRTAKENVHRQLRELGVEEPIDKIQLLTNLRILGYVFNPVSFYFCFRGESHLIGILVEVNNTYGEQKPYFLKVDRELSAINTISAQSLKNFYVSPFLKHDRDFQFRIKPPGETLAISINTLHQGKLELQAVMSGKEKEITFANLLLCFFRFPLITVYIIFMIHYHALVLWLKKIPYFAKKSTDTQILQLKPKEKEIIHGRINESC
ncbi:MAG: DUF1365 domain-containing protein [Spirochaetota bacterium]